MKRNQEIVVSLGNTEVFGKVSAIGRDFVMITNLNKRIWIPFHAIQSANLPTGIPSFSNSHQYFIYDNDLRRKLLQHFGETVAKREVLIQQFYEESLVTNLTSWCKTWVKIQHDQEVIFGKIQSVTQQKLVLLLLKEKIEVDLTNIKMIESIRLFNLLSLLGKKRFGLF